jgi:hypothetical protein
MPNISLPTGKVIYVPSYDYYFMLEDTDIHEFYQSCIADDLGRFIDDPFSQKVSPGKIEINDIDELPSEDVYE